MPPTFHVHDHVEIYLDSKFGDREGWYAGTVIRIDPYSAHRSFYWVELNEDAQAVLQIKQISVFNLKKIRNSKQHDDTGTLSETPDQDPDILRT